MLAEDGGHDVLERRGMQHALQGNLAVAGHGGGDVGGRGGADGGAVVRGPAHAPRAEQVRGGEAAEPTPVRVAGRSEAHGAVEEQVARRVLDGAVAERRADEDLARRVRLAGHHEPREADREGHQCRAAVDGAGQRRQRAVRYGAGERGDHARRAGRRAAAAGERPRWPTGGEPQEQGSQDEGRDEGRQWGGCREEEQEERVLMAGGHGEHHGCLGGVGDEGFGEVGGMVRGRERLNRRESTADVAAVKANNFLISV